MADLKIRVEDVISAADQIHTLNQKMADEFEDVRKVMDQLDNSWDGAASDYSREKFHEFCQKYPDSRYQILDRYVGFLHKQVGEGYQTVEDTNKQLAEKLASAFK